MIVKCDRYRPLQTNIALVARIEVGYVEGQTRLKCVTCKTTTRNVQNEGLCQNMNVHKPVGKMMKPSLGIDFAQLFVIVDIYITLGRDGKGSSLFGRGAVRTPQESSMTLDVDKGRKSR